MTKLYDGMSQLYKTSKTLRFELKPIGLTAANIEMEGFLRQDYERSQDYITVKGLMDDYHRWFIDKSLAECQLDQLKEYADLFFKSDKTKSELKQLDAWNSRYRKNVYDVFKQQREFNDLFKEGLLKKLLPEFLLSHHYTEDKLVCIRHFDKFSTYFTPYHETRKNVYSDKDITTSITYRLIHDNLPTHLKNAGTYNRYKDTIIHEIESTSMTDLTVELLSDLFTPEAYNHYFTQKSIRQYNQIIGGYVSVEGKKIQGLNEIINLHNQKVDKNQRIPKFIPLKNQILSREQGDSFVFDAYVNDKEMCDALKAYYRDIKDACLSNENNLVSFFQSIGDYDLTKIYIENNQTLTSISKEIYGAWHFIKDCFFKKYNAEKKLDYEVFEEKYKKEKYFSLQDIIYAINTYGQQDGNLILDKLSKMEDHNVNVVTSFVEAYDALSSVLEEAKDTKRYISDEQAIEKIKYFLDQAKTLQKVVSLTMVRADGLMCDELYYSELTEATNNLSITTDIYDQVRNYLTQKPYSEKKFKLNLGCSTLLDGWDVNKEKDCLGVVLTRDGNYYLGIMNHKNKKLFVNVPDVEDDTYYEKMEYKLIPDPTKMLPKLFFSKKGRDTYNPSDYIYDGYNEGMHKKTSSNFDITFMRDLIDFYKKSLIQYNPIFNFHFSDTQSYQDIGQFMSEVEQQGYYINTRKIPSKWIDEMVYENKLYLFQIYSKDFSKYSKGKKNLHTLYWEAIFSEPNKKNIIYKLDGGAEIFYRPHSLSKDKVAKHIQGQPVLNKNVNNEKKYSTFDYTIYKDKRYTQDKFFFHVPISLNFINENQKNINAFVNKRIKASDQVNVIGIDRGERNLIYVCVIDGNGNILKQMSLNEIVTEYKGRSYKVDYHTLLSEKELERKRARESWQTIENIKELKEGYISIVVNKIVQLMIEYNAIIVLENLDMGFKQTRSKVDKQVYQKFEKALIEKLNFLVMKDCDEYEPGGIYCPLQLTNKFESFKKMGTQIDLVIRD